MPDAQCPGPDAVAADLLLPTDRRFLVTIREFVAQAACQSGFARAEADRVGAAIERLVERIAHHAYGNDPDRSVEIHFRSTEGEMHIDVAYAPAPGGHGAVERGLEAGPDGIVAEVRRIVDRVEFGRGHDREFCRIARRLPVGF